MTDYKSMKNAELLAAWDESPTGEIHSVAQMRFGPEGINAIATLRLHVALDAARADAARYKAQRDAYRAFIDKAMNMVGDEADFYQMVYELDALDKKFAAEQAGGE